MGRGNWQRIELDCTKYLESKYGREDIRFIHEGGADSTLSDIYVEYVSRKIFGIEAKSPQSQCGQFVLLIDGEQKEFFYSPRNKSGLNIYSKKIIDIMNSDFKHYSEHSESHPLPEYPELYARWIISYYKEKNVRFFITKRGNDYIIFPIEEILKYFDISAIYRVKRSGSAKPPKNKISEIIKYLNDEYPDAELENKGKYYELTNYDKGNQRFFIGDSEYFINQEKEKTARISKLSNTWNWNVIFSIRLKRGQDEKDLEKFLDVLNSLSNVILDGNTN